MVKPCVWKDSTPRTNFSCKPCLIASEMGIKTVSAQLKVCNESTCIKLKDIFCRIGRLELRFLKCPCLTQNEISSCTISEVLYSIRHLYKDYQPLCWALCSWSVYATGRPLEVFVWDARRLLCRTLIHGLSSLARTWQSNHGAWTGN
jgi:hypothetical protein